MEMHYIRITNVLIINDATVKFGNVQFEIQNQINKDPQLCKRFIEGFGLEDAEKSAASLFQREAKDSSSFTLPIGATTWHIELENVSMINQGCWTFGDVGFYLEKSSDIGEKKREEIVIENAIICSNSRVEIDNLTMLSTSGKRQREDASDVLAKRRHVGCHGNDTLALMSTEEATISGDNDLMAVQP